MRYIAFVITLFIAGGAWGASATFGYETTPTEISQTWSTTTSPIGFVLSSATYTASAGDSVLWIHFYYASNGSNDSLAAGVYTIASGKPDSLIPVGGKQWLPAGSGFPTYAWDSVATTIALVAGEDYCLAVGEVKGSSPINIYTKGDSSVTVSGDGFQKAIGTTLPDKFGTLGNNRDYIFGLYATLNYEASGGGVTVVSSRYEPAGSGQRHGPSGSSSRYEP